MHINNNAMAELDLILVYVEEKPAFFARIEQIEPDVKKNWWRVTMLVLQIPVKLVTWIIDHEQIRGAEFTMGGIPIRIEKVVVPQELYQLSDEPEDEEKKLEESTSAQNMPKATDSEDQPEKKARILSMGPKKS